MEETKKKFSKRIWKIVYVVLVLACLVCICLMAGYLLIKGEQEDVQEEMKEEVEEVYVQEEAVPELAEQPIDFEGLWEINPEIYAWLKVPDTNINYPILQHEGENQSYYLEHDMYGEVNVAGSIYTEYYNNKDFQDSHTVIYGHNMKNGSMFHDVRYFAEKEYFDAHKELYVYLPDQILKYEIISCYEYDNRHLLGTFDFDNEEAYAEYLEDIMNPRSMYTMIRDGVKITTEDRLVTLSTCIANKPDKRRLLQAVLVEMMDAQYKGAVNETTDEKNN